MQEYQIVGRKFPTATEAAPKLYKMRLFAPNHVVAKSRFFYFLNKLKKIKRATGEIVSISIISEKKPMKIKNFGIWLRYNSRSGTHNMYKEYRELSRADAVKSCCKCICALLANVFDRSGHGCKTPCKVSLNSHYEGRRGSV